MSCSNSGAGAAEARGRPAGDRPRVLLATMQHALRDAIHELLTGEGIPVVGAVDSGSAAVTFVTRERPDIVVMGLVLAGSLNALDALRLIRHAVEPTQIIVLVGVRSDAAARLAVEAGASTVLEEAGKPGRLIEAIAVLWEERRSGHEAAAATLS
jgi:DNA-binding NarL/FixJ family response regulator